MNNEIKELIEYKDLDITDYADAWELYDALEYDGSVHEVIDNKIDIYYVDLRKWSVNNYSYVEDAISEGLCEGVEDFHKLIQAGQYVCFREEANEAIEEVYKELTEEAEQTA